VLAVQNNSKDYKLIIGIDSSVHHIGIATYSRKYQPKTKLLNYPEDYSLPLLNEICNTIEDEVFSGEDLTCDRLCIIEEPLFPMPGLHFSKGITQLNQIAGALVRTAQTYGFDVIYLHNKTVKSRMGFKTKEESVAKAYEMYPYLIDISDHESDALMLVETYKILRKGLNDASESKNNLGTRNSKRSNPIHTKGNKK
jgi:hypothetical protein